MQALRGQLETGSLVAGYRIEELISRGGMGMIYRATHVASDHVYALKVLAPELVDDDVFRQRFTREMRIAASLRHPHVVTIHEADEHDGVPFLAMDLIAGTDLQRVMRESGPIEAPRATNLLAQVASGLDAAHARGLVHRDVKPANILIEVREGVECAYLTDFGLAKKFENDSSLTDLTQTGVVVGTVHYMSPEQITGGQKDARTDVYALGCVFFEMLTGAVPYERDDSLMATMFAHVHEVPPSLEGRLVELYPSLGAAIERAMAKDPAERYPSAGEFARDAAAALQGSGYAGPRRLDSSLAFEPRSRGRRKVVTVLCCRLLAAVRGEDPDGGLTDRCFDDVRSVIIQHGGTVGTPIDDEVSAVFGIPQAHEDDALRAVRAAADIHERFSAVADDMGVEVNARIGVNTGLVLAGSAEDGATGDAVTVAATLEKAAAAGDILLGSETLRLVRDAVDVQPLEPLSLMDRPESIPVFRLVRLDRVAPGLARRFDIPFVGRDRELGLLRAAWGRAVAQRGCHLFTVLGEAGVGKSRLVAELLENIGDSARVLRGRCLPYGEGITFWPLTEALAPLGHAAASVVGLLGGGSVAAPEELFLKVRLLLEALAAERPLVLHVDDLQWAEPMLLDLLEHILSLSRLAPILVLCAARVELLDVRPGWGGGIGNATTALLEPLGATESETLLDRLADDLTHELRSQVLTASEGNPLFLEEMVALARERDMVTVPATIQALLTERLERLASEEREVLECAAVEGEVFHRRAVLALLDDPAAGRLDSLLPVLLRKNLIRPHPATLDADNAFRFRHLLLRDAAYDALDEQTRAKLHERFGGWLEAGGRQVAELDEIAGWHLEQAVRYGEQLGWVAQPELGRRAAVHLHAAGRRARNRGDVAAAKNLFQRAFVLAPAGEVASAQIGVDLAERLVEAGEVARADELLSAADLDAEAGALAALTRFEWMIRVRPHEAMQTIEAKLPRILQQLAEADDHSGIARAHLVASMPHWLASQWTLAGEQARLAAEHAHKAGDEGLRSRALAFYVGSIIYGRADVGEIARELDTIERDEPGASLAARVDLGRGQLARLKGRMTDARRLMERAIEGFRALGMRELEAACDHELGVTELSAGDPAAALAWLLRSDAILAELGQHSLRSTTQALMAQTQELLNNEAAARAAIELAERLSAPEDALTFAITQRVRARLALSDENREAAHRWARSAVAYAFRTDAPIVRAEATLDFARVLVSLERRDDAASEARAALELFAAKGDRPGIEQTRELIDELGSRT
jgi:class 3 adenylate cyclase/tRNA A-37 threonylcarbamoyl transferase component Bud32